MTCSATHRRRADRSRRCALLAAVLAVTVVASVSAQTAPSAPPTRRATGVDGVSLLATIRALTAPGMDGRAAGTAGGAKARAWLEARLKALGAEPVSATGFARPFSFTTKAGAVTSGTNVLARCPGRRRNGPVVVVSAHYDHLGVREGQIYPGADDNASGVAMLLRVAQQCVTTPYAHPLVLAFFDGEESGLQGAKAFLADPAVPTARIVLNLNFDMVSRSDTREIYVAGPGRWPKLLPLLKAPATRARLHVKFGHDMGGGQDDWTLQSDHGVFHTAGIPFVYLGVEDHADYHQPTDTADKISPAFLGDVAAFVLDSLTALDRAASFK